MTATPTAVACPNCQAKPGQPCTQPTDTGRKPVGWHHLARIDAAQGNSETIIAKSGEL